MSIEGTTPEYLAAASKRADAYTAALGRLVREEGTEAERAALLDVELKSLLGDKT